MKRFTVFYRTGGGGLVAVVSLLAEDLEDVFDLLNIGFDYLKPFRFSGPEAGLDVWHTSMSVGDAVLDLDSGRLQTCEPRGWS